jgi:membrane associated rhomboid family serine protease
VFDTRTQIAISPQRIFTPAVVSVCILLTLCYLAYFISPAGVASALALSDASLASGKIWTLITYSLLNTSPMALLFNCSIILFLGSAVENQWRALSWVLLWVVVSGICGLLYLAVELILNVNLSLMGSGACAYGLIGTYGLLFRHNSSNLLFGTLKAHHTALLLIAIGILMSLSQPLSLVSVAGAVVAYAYIKVRWYLIQRSANGGIRVVKKKPGAFVDVD